MKGLSEHPRVWVVERNAYHDNDPVIAVFSSEENLNAWLASHNWQYTTEEVPERIYDHDAAAVREALGGVVTSTISYANPKRGTEVIPGYTKYHVTWTLDGQQHERTFNTTWSSMYGRTIEEWIAGGCGEYGFTEIELDVPEKVSEW